MTRNLLFLTFLVSLLSCKYNKVPITYVITEPQKGYQEFCFNGDQYLYVNTNDSKKPLLLILSGQYTEQDSIIQLDANLPINERFDGNRIKQNQLTQ